MNRAIRLRQQTRNDTRGRDSTTLSMAHPHDVITDRRAWGRAALAAGWRFTRHLLAMIVAMVAGMITLALAIGVLGEPPGYANPLVEYSLMGAFMSAPMVAWMRHRGHQWSDGLEMMVAMLVPMFALVLPVELGVARYVPGLS